MSNARGKKSMKTVCRKGDGERERERTTTTKTINALVFISNKTFGRVGCAWHQTKLAYH